MPEANTRVRYFLSSVLRGGIFLASGLLMALEFQTLPLGAGALMLISGPVYMVSGNNDYFLDLPPKIITKIGNYRVMIVHGHTYHVYRDTSYLRKCALEEKVDVVMFGHTHVPYIDIGPDLTILNPGSLSYPRQADRKPTFLMMEIDEDGNAHYGHGYYKSKFSELII